MSEIHSVVFLPDGKKKWNSQTAMAWLKKHKLKPIKRVDKVYTDGKLTQLRYRIQDPDMFKRFITKKSNADINFIIGFPK